MPKPNTKECPRCGNEFICTMNHQCWCMEVTIPVEVQEIIAAEFDDCLCKNCIEEYIEKYSTNNLPSSNQSDQSFKNE